MTIIIVIIIITIIVVSGIIINIHSSKYYAGNCRQESGACFPERKRDTSGSKKQQDGYRQPGEWRFKDSSICKHEQRFSSFKLLGEDILLVPLPLKTGQFSLSPLSLL